MNSTNRGLNRLFILITGVLVLVAGAASVAIGAIPLVTSQWRRSAVDLANGAPPWVSTPSVGKASLLVLAMVVGAAVLVLLLIAFIAKQGRGRTAAALQRQDGSSSTRIDLAVPKALLEEHLKMRDELVGLRISAYEVRSTPMLKITAKCRRGISPAVVSELIGRAVTDLEQIVGADVPTFVQLTGGFRTGSASRPHVA